MVIVIGHHLESSTSPVAAVTTITAAATAHIGLRHGHRRILPAVAPPQQQEGGHADRSRFDAKHLRNVVARFDQVEDVTDADRDRAWRRIRAAARKFGVEIEARGWRQLFSGGTAKKPTKTR